MRLFAFSMCVSAQRLTRLTVSAVELLNTAPVAPSVWTFDCVKTAIRDLAGSAYTSSLSLSRACSRALSVSHPPFVFSIPHVGLVISLSHSLTLSLSLSSLGLSISLSLSLFFSLFLALSLYLSVGLFGSLRLYNFSFEFIMCVVNS